MVVVLAALGAPVAQAAAPQPVTICATMTFNPSGPNYGTFTANGSSLICSSGTVLDARYVGHSTPTGHQIVVDKTFACGDGVLFFRRQVHGVYGVKETFTWVILGGTGAYAHVNG